MKTADLFAARFGEGEAVWSPMRPVWVAGWLMSAWVSGVCGVGREGGVLMKNGHSTLQATAEQWAARQQELLRFPALP
eukprot:97923-Chlamydomonas_euryale.AAC.1